MPTELGVVIVNYRTSDLAAACLRSLAPEVAAHRGTRVVIVDNASGDGSAERLSAAVAERGWGWASVVASPHNRGFSAGNNAGIDRLRDGGEPPAWFLLLNPDTLVRPGALGALLETARSRPRIGIVGGGLEGEDGTPQHAGFRFPSAWSELDAGMQLGVVSRLLRHRAVVLPHAGAPRPVDWVSGACLMVRREVLEEVGRMDEGYFLYYEEVDLCRRAARAGWECWQEPRARVVHLVGQSTGADLSGARRLPGYVLDSRRRYFVKHHGASYAALADVAWLSGHLSWRARAMLQRSRRRPAPGMVGDFVRHSVLLRGAR
jgi:GT2 family glycosyltransferase